MNDSTTSKAKDPRRFLPSVDELLTSELGAGAVSRFGAKIAAGLCRNAIAECRSGLEAVAEQPETSHIHDLTQAKLKRLIDERILSRQQKVINATGVIIHTNLGRAPLSTAAADAVLATAGSANVELNLSNGRRGRRGGFTEDLLAELTGAEAALIVNNCAAAAFLVLSVLAAGREVIVSRGELVEIGGDFRVPDVLSQSGATLREVGTTNRTKIQDYERAVGPDTAVLLRVHPSNYKIIGFTAAPTNRELSELARSKDLVFYHDAGSGALVDLSEFGLADEPVISSSIADGADIVTFSGDKLLGGPQAGLIVGRKDLIEKIRKHSLYRALRAGKLIYAALDATLDAYLRGTHFQEIPVLKMLSATPTEISKRSEDFVSKFNGSLQEGDLRLQIVAGHSVVGGGSAPGVEPLSSLIAVEIGEWTADKIAAEFRNLKYPVIGRIVEDQFALDLRTVTDANEINLADSLQQLSHSARRIQT